MPTAKRRRKENVIVAILRGLLPWKGDSGGEVVRKIIFLGGIAAIVIAGLTMIDYYVMRPQRIAEYDRVLVEQRAKYRGDDVVTMRLQTDSDNDSSTADVAGDVSVIGEYVSYYEENPDFVGWVTIDPIINYPVAQSDDNEYYTKHNFNNVPTANGTIFADFENVFGPGLRSPNTIIYGHNLRTNYLFQPLVNYRKPAMFDDFVKSHLTITFDTLYDRGTYKIFAAFLLNESDTLGEVFEYWKHVDFDSKEEFDGYVAECLDRSYFYTGVDLQYGDELIALSTCDFSMFSIGDTAFTRLLVVGRRVRENESPVVDPAEFIDNSGYDENGRIKRKMFRAYYENWGQEWAGRNWDESYIKDYSGAVLPLAPDAGG
jgi:sortase B